MQNFCTKCGASHEEAGKIIFGKCWFCRYPNMLNRKSAIINRRTHLKAYGSEKQQRKFEKFIKKNGSGRMRSEELINNAHQRSDTRCNYCGKPCIGTICRACQKKVGVI